MPYMCSPKFETAPTICTTSAPTACAKKVNWNLIWRTVCMYFIFPIICSLFLLFYVVSVWNMSVCAYPDSSMYRRVCPLSLCKSKAVCVSPLSMIRALGSYWHGRTLHNPDDLIRITPQNDPLNQQFSQAEYYNNSSIII